MRLRRFRGWFGIAAPKVAIRPHLPWYWRALLTATVLVGGLAIAGWVYDAGRSFAGFERSESDQRLDTLKQRLGALEDELERLRKVANVSENSLQIERTAQQKLADQVRRLERENSQLKEELAVFESLAGGGVKSAAPGISRFELEHDPNSGRCRFRLLVTAGAGHQERPLDARLLITVTAVQDGKPAILKFPSAAEQNSPSFNLSLRRYLRQEGSFQLPLGARISDAEASLLVGGATVASKRAAL